MSAVMSGETTSNPSSLEKWLNTNVCEPAQRLIPLSVHPNYITVGNLLVCFVNLAFGFQASKYDESNQPAAACAMRFISGSLMFLSMVLDCVDGIHARKTGKSSHMGECLDHCLDALTTQLLSASTLLVFRGSLVISVLTLIETAAVYHAQILVYRSRHILIDGPTSGLEGQTLAAISHIVCGVFIYYLDFRSTGCEFAILMFFLVATVIQLNDCRYFFVLLCHDSLEQSYAYFLLTSLAFGFLSFLDLVSQMEFFFIYAFVPFRSTGLLVLYSIVEKISPGTIPKERISMLGALDPFLLGWLTAFASVRILLPVDHFLSTSIVFLFCANVTIVNCVHFYFCIPLLQKQQLSLNKED